MKISLRSSNLIVDSSFDTYMPIFISLRLANSSLNSDKQTKISSVLIYAFYICLYMLTFYACFLYAFYMLFICFLYAFYILFICFLYAFYMLFICFLYAFYVLFIYFLYAFYMLFICFLYAFYMLFIYFLLLAFYACFLYAFYMLAFYGCFLYMLFIYAFYIFVLIYATLMPLSVWAQKPLKIIL